MIVGVGWGGWVGSVYVYCYIYLYVCNNRDV